MPLWALSIDSDLSMKSVEYESIYQILWSAQYLIQSTVDQFLSERPTVRVVKCVAPVSCVLNRSLSIFISICNWIDRLKSLIGSIIFPNFFRFTVFPVWLIKFASVTATYWCIIGNSNFFFVGKIVLLTFYLSEFFLGFYFLSEMLNLSASCAYCYLSDFHKTKGPCKLYLKKFPDEIYVRTHPYSLPYFPGKSLQ